MDTVRYLIALVTIVMLPPAVLLWYAIHPFAGFWRRFGPGWTYAVLGIPAVAMMVGLFAVRDRLLGTDFGTSYPLTAAGILCVTVAMVIAMKRKKYLTFRILAGIPELSRRAEPGKLLNQGIYASIRHPRYVELVLAMLGYALIANYLGSYFLFILFVPAIYLIVLMEERELRERFGAEYEEYCRRIPRFIPRHRPSSG
jgi:protein-S-isoprenylcysteine O-methyltransferase Ste14